MLKTILPKALASSLPALATTAAIALFSTSAAAQEACGPTVVIQPGDTLSAIAERCGLPLDSVLAANPGIDPATLQVGQEITLDASAAPLPADGGLVEPAPDAGFEPEPVPLPEPVPEPGLEPAPEPLPLEPQSM